jgi:hypothetical protein
VFLHSRAKLAHHSLAIHQPLTQILKQTIICYNMLVDSNGERQNTHKHIALNIEKFRCTWPQQILSMHQIIVFLTKHKGWTLSLLIPKGSMTILTKTKLGMVVGPCKELAFYYNVLRVVISWTFSMIPQELALFWGEIRRPCIVVTWQFVSAWKKCSRLRLKWTRTLVMHMMRSAKWKAWRRN